MCSKDALSVIVSGCSTLEFGFVLTDETARISLLEGGTEELKLKQRKLDEKNLKDEAVKVRSSSVSNIVQITIRWSP